MSLKARVDRLARDTATLRCPLCCDGLCSWQSSRAVIVFAGNPIPAVPLCPACGEPRSVFVIGLCETVTLDRVSVPGVPL